MQHLQDLKNRIFFEAQNIIESLDKISTMDELLLKQDLVSELSDRIVFLKFLEKNQDYFSDKQQVEEQNHLLDVSDVEEFSYEVTEEEAIFNNELNEIETPVQQEIIVEKDEIEPIISEPSVENSEIVSETSNMESLVNEMKISEPEIVIEEPISQPEINAEATDIVEEPVPQTQENKIKLANIKGIKPQEPVIEKEERISIEEKTLAKPEVSLDYLEDKSSRTKEFRLDLNDRIAFSKWLFDGSQSELNEVVNNLNQFKNIDEAKEYLSDLYYEKKWEKADEYAQRLWTLVENKFL